MFRYLIAAILASQGLAHADSFYEPQGIDAKSGASVHRVISGAYSQNNVVSGQTQVNTGPAFNSGQRGDVICQQGVRNESASKQPNFVGGDAPIVVIDSNNVCTGR
ncbi:MAG: hypothetical protein ACPGFA_08215 [Pikeienuella sp.]